MGNPKTTVVLIDGRNLGGAFQEWRGYRLEKIIFNIIDEIKNKLDIEMELIRVYYHYSQITKLSEKIPEEYREKWVREKERTDSFLNDIAKIPRWDVICGIRIPRYNDELDRWFLAEKGVDMRLGINLVKLSNRYEVIILVSGDTDYCYAISTAKDAGKPELCIVVAIPGNQLSQDLVNSADLHLRITEQHIIAAGGQKRMKAYKRGEKPKE
jgi:uncharacterized LabA/DUF88 family protein